MCTRRRDTSLFWNREQRTMWIRWSERKKMPTASVSPTMIEVNNGQTAEWRHAHSVIFSEHTNLLSNECAYALVLLFFCHCRLLSVCENYFRLCTENSEHFLNGFFCRWVRPHEKKNLILMLNSKICFYYAYESFLSPSSNNMYACNYFFEKKADCKRASDPWMKLKEWKIV